jgi:hypothetical protein
MIPNSLAVSREVADRTVGAAQKFAREKKRKWLKRKGDSALKV